MINIKPDSVICLFHLPVLQLLFFRQRIKEEPYPEFHFFVLILVGKGQKPARPQGIKWNISLWYQLTFNEKFLEIGQNIGHSYTPWISTPLRTWYLLIQVSLVQSAFHRCESPIGYCSHPRPYGRGIPTGIKKFLPGWDMLHAKAAILYVLSISR